MSEDYLAQAQPTQTWNTVRGVWEKQGIANLLCEHWELFSETWPTSGMMRNGKVYELPTQGPRITDSEFSSLPTPSAAQEPGWTVKPVDKNGEPTTNPNERWHDPKTGRVMQKGIIQALRFASPSLMPTPTAVDGNTVAKSELDGNDPKHRLKVAAQVLARDKMEWGKFGPAIRRWEQTLGRLAPLPTKPDGKDGAHRLSSAFTEWMMGLPEGWVTGVGLTRNEELKACGNGVVPQQAELALRVLLEGLTIPSTKNSKLFATPNTMDSLPPRYGEAYEKVKNAGGRKNRESSGNLREQVVHVLPGNPGEITMLPTPTVSDTYTDNLKSTQQKEGSMHSVTLPQAVRMVNFNIVKENTYEN